MAEPYVDFVIYAGPSNTPWSRRIKAPLKGITWEMGILARFWKPAFPARHETATRMRDSTPRRRLDSALGKL